MLGLMLGLMLLLQLGPTVVILAVLSFERSRGSIHKAAK
jgi:hypothetical protein